MTKGEIDRLGTKIGASSVVESADLEQLQEYRQTFQEPLSKVFSFVLAAARKIDRQSIVTYRIKRIDTIIGKLRRFKENENGKMNLSRMWDIAGCRCIMSSPDINKLYQLRDVILKEFGADCKINDHVAKPKTSGYRSIHVYVKDKETQKPIEIQIRNEEQHNWATLVEIVDLLYESKNKERGATGPLGQFLFMYSKASELSEKEFDDMLNLERRMNVFERMSKAMTRNYLNIRRQWLTQKRQGCYFVITANKKKSEIVSFQTFKKAEAAYYEKYLENSDSNIVLTYLQNPEFDQISMAYSNYVLAMHTFFNDYRALLAEKIIESVEKGHYHLFFKYFHTYNNDVRYHFENMSKELKSINACYKDSTIPRNQITNWIKDINYRLSLWNTETNDFLKKLMQVSEGNSFKRFIVKNRIKRLKKAVSEGQHAIRK